MFYVSILLTAKVERIEVMSLLLFTKLKDSEGFDIH